MTALADFLLARLDEDEEMSRGVTGWEPWYPDSKNQLELNHDGFMISPDRVRAECESKRAIIEAVVPRRGSTYDDRILRHLAMVYAEHPDFREEWRL